LAADTVDQTIATNGSARATESLGIIKTLVLQIEKDVDERNNHHWSQSVAENADHFVELDEFILKVEIMFVLGS
jgi:hypothetical protein